ncbi:MAG TPA: glycosyltransferase [Thermoanaerobaculia bacterium]|nr:glycosyltransferase [Thermoanaerobaculia bacterium]
MIGTVARVVRTEGLSSAVRRVQERVSESLHRGSLLVRGAKPSAIPILNVSMMGVSPRLGGVPTQLLFRLRAERTMRDVALYSPGFLELPSHGRRVGSVAEALAITGARTIHLEGTFGVRPEDVLHDGVSLMVSVHDMTAPRELLDAARVVVFASRFLRDRYDVDGEIIEPGVPASGITAGGPHIAFAGAMKRHKGAGLLAELAELTPGLQWHAFGGGDVALPPSIRRHGYYRAGALPSLLARHRIGRVVLPSLFEESFGVALSECWQAGVPVIAFDHAALGARIREQGGGWLAPCWAGAAGLAEIINRGGTVAVPRDVPTSTDAANAYIELYRRCTMLASQ